MTQHRSIGDVVRRQLCTGCGVCSYLAPDRFEMVDAHAERVERPEEIRPALDRALAADRVALVHVRMDPKVTRMSGGVYLR